MTQGVSRRWGRTVEDLCQTRRDKLYCVSMFCSSNMVVKLLQILIMSFSSYTFFLFMFEGLLLPKGPRWGHYFHLVYNYFLQEYLSL